MDMLLDKIFEGAYAPAQEKPSKEYYALAKVSNGYSKKVARMMGKKFADEYIYAYEDASFQLQKEAFRAGVRFGFQLRKELSESEN